MLSDSELLFPRPNVDKVFENLTDYFHEEEQQKAKSRELSERKKVVEFLKNKIKKHRGLDENSLAEVLQSSKQGLNTLISLLGITQALLSAKIGGGHGSGSGTN